MEQERGWLAEEMRRTTEAINAMPNGRALVEEAAFRAERDNRVEASALKEILASGDSDGRLL